MLVADDHRDFCVAMEELLTTLGFRVICASDGLDALEKLTANPVSVILTDLYMPQMDGVEFIQRLGASGKKIPPVIAITGDEHAASRSVSYAAKALGARAALLKPFTREQLAQAIAFVLASGESVEQTANGVRVSME